MEDMTARPDIHDYRRSQTPARSCDGNSDVSSDVDTSQELKDSQESYQNESHTSEKCTQKNSIGCRKMLTIIIPLLILVIAYGCTQNSKSCSFSDFQKNHPQNEDAWNSLSIGIENIIKGVTDAPAVYLFLNNERKHFGDMILKIAHKASSCFNSENKPVEMDSADFTSEEASKDYGYAIEKYKKKVQEGNVILIVNLNKIPAAAAEALHTICDTTSPLVKNVVILLTLNSQESSDNAVVTAENTLYELWGSKLERSSLDPLVTRLTDQVIALK